MSNAIKTIGVCGAGIMGAGIAQVFALNDFDVIVFDKNKDALERGKKLITSNLEKGVAKGIYNQATADSALKKLQFTESSSAMQVDLLIEAIIEDADAKKALFDEIVPLQKSTSIIVSNTSSLSITALSKTIENPSRFAGMHFFNPAHIMKLVEIVAGAETDEEVIASLKSVCEKIGKTPVICRDSPGFIVNRVARHFYVESLLLAEERIGDFERIDNLLESAGFKMGPFRLMDVIGNDINFAVTSSMHNSFHGASKFKPSRIQEQKVMAGHLGKKSGKGFYTYS